MLEDIESCNAILKTYRITSIPEIDQLISEYVRGAVARASIRSILTRIGLTVSGDELLGRPFQPIPRGRRIRRSRFSDGSFQVFYSALEQDTAEAEREYWFRKDMEVDGDLDFGIYLMFECRFSGVKKDLRSRVRDWPELIHTDDYNFCNRLGSEAKRLALDGLVTCSARRVEGVNLPVFSRSALSGANVISWVEMTYDPATGHVSAQHRRFKR